MLATLGGVGIAATLAAIFGVCAEWWVAHKINRTAPDSRLATTKAWARDAAAGEVAYASSTVADEMHNGYVASKGGLRGARLSRI